MEHQVEIRTGRRDGDGQIRVSLFTEELMALTVIGHTDRAPTLLLTLEQARKLQSAFAELIPLIEAAALEKRVEKAEAWSGEERRRLAS